MAVNWEMYDEQYANIDAPEKPDALPDGNYSAVIDALEFGTWDDGSPKISWRYRVTEGDYAGRVQTSNVGLNQYTKGDFDALGFKGYPISYVVKNATAVNGAAVVIRLKTTEKTGKQYTYLNKVVSLPIVAESTVVPPAPAPAPVAAPAPAHAVAPPAPSQAALPGVPATLDVPF